MPQLRFEGSGDDTFGEVAHTKDDYDNCVSGKPIDYLVMVPGVPGGLIVTGQYGRTLPDSGSVCWQIGVASHDPDDLDLPIPEWPMRFERGSCTYSPALVIDAPDSVQVFSINRQAEAAVEGDLFA